MDVVARICVAVAIGWHILLLGLIANFLWFADTASGAMLSAVGIFYLIITGIVVIPAGMWGWSWLRQEQHRIR
jgi:hypothetical protein